MGIFNFFKKKPKKDVTGRDLFSMSLDGTIDHETYVSLRIEESIRNDFLGKAAVTGHKAKAAVKEKRFDDAWRLYHEQKEHYIKHANRSKFTARQAIALDASVHEDLANILRLEGKHDQALIHIVYWVVASSDHPIKRHEDKLRAYFNRCKYSDTTLEMAKDQIQSITSIADFKQIRSMVGTWS